VRVGALSRRLRNTCRSFCWQLGNLATVPCPCSPCRRTAPHHLSAHPYRQHPATIACLQTLLQIVRLSAVELAAAIRVAAGAPKASPSSLSITSLEAVTVYAHRALYASASPWHLTEVFPHPRTQAP
jgi:hypothetical protein